jgi:hypothetical protein
MNHEDLIDAERARKTDLVEVVVATDDRHDDLFPREVEERLQKLLLRLLQERGDVFDRSDLRRVDLPERGLGFVVFGRVRPSLHRRDLDVRRIFAVVARDDRVLPRIGEDLELGARRSSDRAGVRRDETILEAHTIEDAAVRLPHRLVALLGGVLAHVERISVLHQEFAAAQEAAARAGLVAVFELNLVEVLRHVAPALDLAARDVGDDLFVRRSEMELGALAILQTEEGVAVEIPATGLLEVLPRQERRHEDLERARAIHLLADDSFDLLEHAKAERKEVVHAGADLADVAATHEQRMARVGSVGGSLLDRRDESTRIEHRASHLPRTGWI